MVCMEECEELTNQDGDLTTEWTDGDDAWGTLRSAPKLQLLCLIFQKPRSNYARDEKFGHRYLFHAAVHVNIRAAESVYCMKVAAKTELVVLS